MTRRIIGLTAMIGLVLSLTGAPAFAQNDTHVTGAGAGVYPPDTLYGGVPVSGLEFSLGVAISGGNTAAGQFSATLLGMSAGQPQNIEVDGSVTAGSLTSATTATFSGAATVDMGNGSPALSDVPFTVTVVTNAQGQGTLTLLLGSTNLPVANVNDGILSIQ